MYEHLSNQCDYQKHYQVCLKQVDLAADEYQKARTIAEKLGWMGLVSNIDEFSKHLALNKALFAAKQVSDEELSSLQAFKPKSLDEVAVSEHFVPTSADFSEVIRDEELGQLLQESMQHQESYGGLADFAAAARLKTRGFMREMQGDLDGALALYLQAIDLVERDRRKLKDETSRSDFLNSRIDFYHYPILVLLEQRRHAEAFALLERSKGRAMADLLASRAVVLPNAEERTLYALSVKLRSRIGDLQKQLFGMTSGGAPQAKIAQVTAELQTSQQQYDQLTGQIQSRGGKLQELVVAEPASLAQLQKAMNEEHFEVLQYMIQESALILWHISGDGVTVRNVVLLNADLIKKIDSLQASLEDPNNDFDADTAKELYLFLFAPTRDSIKSKRHVIIPQAELHQLPFEALLDPETGQALGENYQILCSQRQCAAEPEAAGRLQGRKATGWRLRRRAPLRSRRL